MMDQTKALHDLLEAADLMTMLEEVTNPSGSGKLSPAIVSGLRITLRNARQMILASHDYMAQNLVARARANNPQAAINVSSQPLPTAPAARPASSSEANAQQHGVHFNRKDLRASLEKIIDS